MKITKHARILSLVLVLMMALSTAMVFAEEGAPADQTEQTVEELMLEGLDLPEGEVVVGEQAAEAVADEAMMDGEVTPPVDPQPQPQAVLTATATKKYANDASDNGYILNWTISDPSVVAYYQIFLNGVNVTPYVVSVNDVVQTAQPQFISAYANKCEILAPVGGANYYVVALGPAQPIYSNPVTTIVEAGDVLDEIRFENHGLVWYGRTKKKVKIYSTATGKKAVATLPKNTYVRAIGKYPKKVPKFKQPTKVQVETNDGLVGWLRYSDLKGGVKGHIDVKHDYSRSVKEAFVNYKGYSSTSKYLIWVSPRMQRAYVFEGSKGNWKLDRTYRVTTGRFSHPTSAYQTGIFKKKAKVFKVTEKGKRYYFKYASYFGSGVSFHTGTWWAASNKRRGSVVKSGKPGTFGCLRMYTDEAHWIYENVPMDSMTVVTKKA
ncbi:MAG: L,D-transpeptidase [Mogibacterium sp.]|nr:L,D-transpeptidase [Mogibacterium sp.]